MNPITRTTFVNTQPGFNQDELLISPTFDLTGVTNPQLGFDWITDYDDKVTYDFGEVRIHISTNGGLTWDAEIPLWTEESDGPFTTWRWKFEQIDLSAYISQLAILFAFRYSGNSAEAFALINFMIGPATDSTFWTGHANQFWFHLGNRSNDLPFSGTCTGIPNVSTLSDLLPNLNNAAQCQDVLVNPGAYPSLLEGQD